MTDEALTIEEAAAKLKLHPVTVREMCHDGTIKAAKLGHHWRIPRASLDPWCGPAPVPPPAPRALPDVTALREGGGLSRDAIRERAGLDPEPGPSASIPYGIDPATPTDAPSGTVVPLHPVSERPVVRMEVNAGPPSREEVARQRAAEEARRAAPVQAREAFDPSELQYVGREAQPFSGDTFGGGPAE